MVTITVNNGIPTMQTAVPLQNTPMAVVVLALMMIVIAMTAAAAYRAVEIWQLLRQPRRCTIAHDNNALEAQSDQGTKVPENSQSDGREIAESDNQGQEWSYKKRGKPTNDSARNAPRIQNG
jgi:hypothetical protein